MLEIKRERNKIFAQWNFCKIQNSSASSENRLSSYSTDWYY